MSPTRDWERVFHEEREIDAAAERRLLVKELVIIAVVVLLAILREALI